MRRQTRGLFGLAPSSAKKGDMVCSFYGLSVPVLLRRTGSRTGERGNDEFCLLGECYVPGMMNGEALGSRRSVRRFVSDDCPDEYESVYVICVGSVISNKPALLTKFPAEQRRLR